MASPKSSSLLQLNDPVSVQHTTEIDDATNSDDQVTPLEGIISYIGPVPELSSSSNDDDGDIFYGIRFTGSSVGKGMNYDHLISFQHLQERYFSCPVDSALFVPSSSSSNVITKRTLSKLEALRLRRELLSSATATSTATTMSSSTSLPTYTSAITGSNSTGPLGPLTPPRESSSIPLNETVSSATPTATSDLASAPKNRLEELRMRREALKIAKQQQAPTVSVDKASLSTMTPIKTSLDVLDATSPEPSPLLSGKNDTAMSWQHRLEELTQQLAVREKETMQLNRELRQCQQENQTYQAQVMQLQTNLEIASQRTTTPSASVPTTETTSNDEMSALREEISQWQSSYSEIQDQLARVQSEWTTCQTSLRETAAAHEQVVVELTRARAEATSYQNQLRTQTDQNDQRGTSDAVHYKERAKLSADISALKRKIEQMEKEKMDLEAAVEDITLDKEQLQEEKDAMEEKYEDLKLDAETAQMEVEELRMELEDAKAAAGRMMGVTETLTAAAMASAGSPSSKANDAGVDSMEMIQSLQTQNARLREALIRLREQSALEKMELTRQLRSVEKAAETNIAVENRVEELTAVNRNLSEQVNDLKDMVEQGAAFEGMVEDLSDRVLGLEEQNVALQAMIRELEEAAELTAEMEEVQADELKALSRDLEGRDTMIRNLEEAIKMYVRFLLVLDANRMLYCKYTELLVVFFRFAGNGGERTISVVPSVTTKQRLIHCVKRSKLCWKYIRGVKVKRAI